MRTWPPGRSFPYKDSYKTTETPARVASCAAPLDVRHILRHRMSPDDVWLRCPPPVRCGCPLSPRVLNRGIEAKMDDASSFGYWVRRLRKHLDLTQVELAHRVACAPKTIEKIEADQRRPSQAMADRLADALELTGDRRSTFLDAARRDGWTDGVAPPLPIPGLPDAGTTARRAIPVPPTPLIGRTHEVAAVCKALEDPYVRLLTLIGPGGVGKTRLALQVAAHMEPAFADGVVFVDLAPIREPDLVPTTVAQILGLPGVDGQLLPARLQATLSNKCLLLVLDNFEQVAGAAPMVANLLAAAPKLKVLITSRIVVGVYGERLVEVAPLCYPAQLPPLEQALAYEAIHLFVERARSVKADFMVGHDNVAAVVAICHRLEGLPLALELAAARVRLLSPQVLLSRLDHRLTLLMGGAQTLPLRQQTLRATFDWSYHLLDAREQRLFRRLAVFVGGSTLEAAEVVCNVEDAPPLDVLNGLQSLVDKSLLRKEDAHAELRVTMLETIREYALEQLDASGELEAVRSRHAKFFVTLAETARPASKGPQQVQWFNRLEREHPNMRAALAWSRTQTSGQTGLRLSVALGDFWAERGHLSEGRAWLTDALMQSETSVASRTPTQAHLELRAKALGRAGLLALWQSDLANAQAAVEASLALRQELGDSTGIALELSHLGMVFLNHGDHERSGALLKESLALSRTVGDVRRVAWCLFYLGLLAYTQRYSRQAGQLWEESLTYFRAEEELWGSATICTYLSMVALDQGDGDRARTHVAESLTLLQEVHDRWMTALTLEVFAGLVAAQRQRPADAQWRCIQAARMFGAAEALRTSIGAPTPPVNRTAYERAVAAARAQLDAGTWAAAWAEGQAMALEEAIAYALTLASPQDPVSTDSHSGAPTAAPALAPSLSHPPRPAMLKDRPVQSSEILTARELEVLHLVAEGLTNAQVAETLVISPRTVEKHLDAIYGKLQVSSRTAAARYATASTSSEPCLIRSKDA